MKEYKYLGYYGKQIYEDPISGKTTIHISTKLLDEIKNFYNDVLEKDFNPSEVITDFKYLINNEFSFTHGGGYAIEDVDLLGFDGSGIMKKCFKSYQEYLSEKSSSNLNNLERDIDYYNNHKHQNYDEISKNYINQEKSFFKEDELVI